MEAASTELIPDPNMSQENDDSAAAAAAAAGDCSIAEVKAETLGMELPSKNPLVLITA